MTLREFERTLFAVYAADDASSLASAMTELVHPQFRVLTSALEAFSYDYSSYRVLGARLQAEPPAGYQECLHDHPLNHHALDRSASSFVQLANHPGYATWERTDHFNGLSRPMGWRDQILFLGRGRSEFGCLSFCRDRPFNASEAGWLRLLNPHWQSAWRRLQRPEAAPGQSWEWFWLELTDRFKPRAWDPVLLSAISSCFPDWRIRSDPLPQRMLAWARAERQRIASGNGPMASLKAQSSSFDVHLRYFPALSGHKGRIRATVVRKSAPLPENRGGLTPRQFEVLRWVAAGKRDSEVAHILGCSTATVSKHLEGVYARLGCSTRTEAAHWLSSFERKRVSSHG